MLRRDTVVVEDESSFLDFSILFDRFALLIVVVVVLLLLLYDEERVREDLREKLEVFVKRCIGGGAGGRRRDCMDAVVVGDSDRCVDIETSETDEEDEVRLALLLLLLVFAQRPSRKS